MLKRYLSTALILTASLTWGCGSGGTDLAASGTQAGISSTTASTDTSNLLATGETATSASPGASPAATPTSGGAALTPADPLSSRALIGLLLLPDGPPGPGGPGVPPDPTGSPGAIASLLDSGGLGTPPGSGGPAGPGPGLPPGPGGLGMGGPPPGVSPGALPQGSPPAGPIPREPGSPLALLEGLVGEMVRQAPPESGTVSGFPSGTVQYSVANTSVSAQYAAFARGPASLTGLLGLQWSGNIPRPGVAPGQLQGLSGEALMTATALQLTGPDQVTRTLDGTLKVSLGGTSATTLRIVREANLKGPDLSLQGLVRTTDLTPGESGGSQHTVTGTLSSGSSTLQVVTVQPVVGSRGVGLTQGEVSLSGSESIVLRVVSPNVVEVARGGASEQVNLSQSPR